MEEGAGARRRGGGWLMSRVPTVRTGLDEDARFELAMAAGAQAKQNRPVMLVAASSLVLVAALVLAMWSLLSRNATLRERLLALSDEQSVQQMSKEWQELSSQEPGQVGLGVRMPGLLSRMEQLAAESGLKDKPTSPQQKTEQLKGIDVTQYTYASVKDTSLAALMEWVRKATEIPGMEVMDLRLKPDATSWTMNVTFRRWERAG